MNFRCFKLLAGMGLFACLGLSTTNLEGVLASVKSTGMAATAIAFPQDALAGAYNPAGMIEVGDRFDIGAYWIHDQGHAKVTGNTLGALVPGINGSFDPFRTNDFFSGDFGINKNFCTEICGDCWNWSLGLVVYNRNFQKTTYKDPFPLLGTSKLGMEYLNETIAPTFSVRLNDCHTLGLSVNIQIQRLKINGVQNFDNPFFSASPGHVTNRGYNWSSGVGVTLGWRWQINECLAFGLTYQPKTNMHKLEKYKGFFAQHGRLDVPEKVGVGIAWDFMPCATACFDYEYVGWSNVKAAHNNLDFANLLGDSNGSGFGFRDHHFFRVGVQYELNDCWTVRAGFRHANQLFSTSQYATNLLTDDLCQNFLTLGATWNWDECNEVSFLAVIGFEHEATGHGAIPVALGGGDIKLKENKYGLGVSWGHKF